MPVRRTARPPTPDATCAAAVDLARAAAELDAPAGTVGDHLGFVADDERVGSHRFASSAPGYRGWVWTVTVARASRAKKVTVDEVVLLPGDGAVLAPPWVPWHDRVRPGDLGVGDVLPSPPDDLRLAPGWSGADDPEGETADSTLRPEQWELGLGRPRVLSSIGRLEAFDRWQSGDRGPQSPMAKAAPAHCSSCGFLVPVGGPFGQAFGVCAHPLSPADGGVVSLEYGCGAHSQAEAEVRVIDVRPAGEGGYDLVDLDAAAAADDADPDPGPGPGPGDAPDAAPGAEAAELGHS
ncbi:MAG: DUF3027 domain-containing protein [Actinomycetota bacterium]|nr:MAG: DUF3027 domain-containing protein [Actinomycetota bacterium]